jgi:hypothetical protein
VEGNAAMEIRFFLETMILNIERKCFAQTLYWWIPSENELLISGIWNSHRTASQNVLAPGLEVSDGARNTVSVQTHCWM